MPKIRVLVIVLAPFWPGLIVIFPELEREKSKETGGFTFTITLSGAELTEFLIQVRIYV